MSSIERTPCLRADGEVKSAYTESVMFLKATPKPDTFNIILLDSKTRRDASMRCSRITLLLLAALAYTFGYLIISTFLKSSAIEGASSLTSAPVPSSPNGAAASPSLKCSTQNVVTGVAVGAAVGLLVIPAALLIIGLSPAGPVAGGLFAANMGAALAAGGFMAGVQSFAMSSGAAIATAITAGAGAAGGATAACI